MSKNTSDQNTHLYAREYRHAIKAFSSAITSAAKAIPDLQDQEPRYVVEIRLHSINTATSNTTSAGVKRSQPERDDQSSSSPSPPPPTTSSSSNKKPTKEPRIHPGTGKEWHPDTIKPMAIDAVETVRAKHPELNTNRSSSKPSAPPRLPPPAPPTAPAPVGKMLPAYDQKKTKYMIKGQHGWQKYPDRAPIRYILGKVEYDSDGEAVGGAMWTSLTSDRRRRRKLTDNKRLNTKWKELDPFEEGLHSYPIRTKFSKEEIASWTNTDNDDPVPADA